MTEIIPFRGVGTDALLSLWTRAQPHDPVTRGELLKKLFLDPNFTSDGLLAFMKDGMLAGAVNVTRRRRPAPDDGGIDARTGYINMLLVSPGEDEYAVGSALLGAAETVMRGWGLSRCTTAYPPLYFTQGVEYVAHPTLARAFSDRGYSGVPSVAKELDLTSYEESEHAANRREALAGAGYAVRPVRADDLPAVLDPRAPFSNPSWAEEFRMRLAASCDLGTMRVAVKRTTSPHAAEVVVGACIFGDPNSNAERFGPFGVSPAERGAGLGTVLLADTLAEMKRRGLRRAWMQWADESGPAHTVYTHAGFRVTKHYLTFTKERM